MLLASRAMTCRTLLLLLLAPFAIACGSSSGYSDKCRVACNPSSVMQCTSMDPSMCQHDCEALTNGLSATCATCVTQSNAWAYGQDHRGSGTTGCHGYAFPSITDTSSLGCASSCH
jgi:hypothetical protein